jgi:hypothetical protein
MVLGLVSAVVVAGCDSSGSKTKTTSATVTWADGVCSAVSSYTNAVKDAAATLKGENLSRSGLNDAVSGMKEATQTFATTIRGLGSPGTSAGESAKQTLDDLSSALKEDASAMQAATGGSSTLSAVSVVSTTLLTAQSQIISAFEELKKSDAKGELQAAYAQAPSCSSFPGL